MYLKYKFEATLEAIKKNEEKFANLIKEGSNNFEDYRNFAYFSGLHNGFNLAWKGFDGCSEVDYDEICKEIFNLEEIAN